MTPEETAKTSAQAITMVGSHFMMYGHTYKRGAELGFAGMDFYVVGRGGAIGDVDADVVASAFFFFEPAMIRTAWENGTTVLSPAKAAVEWALAAHAWAEEHVPDDLDAARLAELAGRLVADASPAGAPIFAGWRRLPLPESPKALAVHHMNGLRELRGGLHGGAVLAQGLRPLEAVLVKTPHMAPIFGWSEPHPEVGDKHAAWEAAEEGTNRAIAAVFGCLREAERAEFAELANALHAATTT